MQYSRGLFHVDPYSCQLTVHQHTCAATAMAPCPLSPVPCPCDACSAPHIIQTQLQEVLGAVVYSDFPEAWPGLLETIMGHLTSNVRGKLRPGFPGTVCLAVAAAAAGRQHGCCNLPGLVQHAQPLHCSVAAKQLAPQAPGRPSCIPWFWRLVLVKLAIFEPQGVQLGVQGAWGANSAFFATQGPEMHRHLPRTCGAAVSCPVLSCAGPAPHVWWPCGTQGSGAQV